MARNLEKIIVMYGLCTTSYVGSLVLKYEIVSEINRIKVITGGGGGVGGGEAGYDYI
jgi:hypothetical protein